MSYQAVFITTFLSLFASMKLVAHYLSKSPNNLLAFLFLTPIISPLSKRSNLKKSTSLIRETLMRFMVYGALVLVSYHLYQTLFTQYNFSTLTKSYFLTLFLYLFTEYMGSFFQCLTLLQSEVPLNIHSKPYLASSLSEFWGKRWNRWVRDWLHTIASAISKKNKTVTLFLAFFISGLFHEIMFALPYYITFQKSYFGYMSLFFMLQFLGVALEKRLFSKWPPLIKRIYMWSFIILPSPLFINESFLRFFGF